MPPKSSNPRTGFVFLHFLPWLILCLGFAITYIAQGITQQHAKAVLQEEFNFRFNEIIANIESRLTGYKSVLSGAAGLFVASQVVDRNGFRNYVSALNLERRYPGIQGVRETYAALSGVGCGDCSPMTIGDRMRNKILPHH